MIIKSTKSCIKFNFFCKIKHNKDDNNIDIVIINNNDNNNNNKQINN